MASHLMGAYCAGILSVYSLATHAVPISGQGTWESTLQGRDLDGNAGNGFEAYYDTTLDITWLANAAGTTMTWAAANAWAAGLDVHGVTDWRLPTTDPINGMSYNTPLSADGSTDRGTAATTTDGTDGGWRDGSGIPVSEMGHMYYVTLGNLGLCDPGFPWCTEQSGWGLDNTGPFSNFQPVTYWSGSEFNSSFAWRFFFDRGDQGRGNKDVALFAWAVRSGDVSAVPLPATVWLFGSGLMGMIGIAKRRKT